MLVPVAARAQLDLQNLVPCAEEGEVCRMPHPTNVYYGVRGKTAGRPFPQGGVIPCNNQSFAGDPAPGQRKRCWYAPRLADRRQGGGGGGYRRDDEPGYRRDRDYDSGYRRREEPEYRGRDYDRGARDYDRPPRDYGERRRSRDLDDE
ncbi:hypothetical protein [Methylobacterium oryzisoli]|uniref:hypothetical protein n=1 Tax=Methylobacterium oryzisoli TaxID=3385502 RepID=UPI003891BA92